jgi:hypothetical protein
MKKVLVILVISLALLSCTKDDVNSCDCEEETTGFIVSIDGIIRPFVSYKKIETPDCNDDGRVITMDGNSTTIIRCK